MSAQGLLIQIIMVQIIVMTLVDKALHLLASEEMYNCFYCLLKFPTLTTPIDWLVVQDFNC